MLFLSLFFSPVLRCRLVRFLFKHLTPSHIPSPIHSFSWACFHGRWCRLVYYYLADYVFSLLSTSVLTYTNNKNTISSQSSTSSKTNICIIRSRESHKIHNSFLSLSLELSSFFLLARLFVVCVRKCMFRTKMPISIYNLCIHAYTTHKQDVVCVHNTYI